MRPICVECKVEMHPETTGVGLLYHASYGPYKIHEADEWMCPKCNHEIVTGIAINGLHHNTDGRSAALFETSVKWHTEHSTLREVY